MDGRSLRHVLEVRHDSFACAEYLDLARKYKAATVFTDSDKFPSFADLTGEFVYARMMRSSIRMRSGYAERKLDAWVQRFRTWRDGGVPEDLPFVESGAPAGGEPRDVFVFFINGDKQRAPAAAQAALKRLAAPAS